MKFKDQYKHSKNQCWVLHKCLLEEQKMKLKRKIEIFQKEQWKAEEKITCKKFNKLIKNTKTVICNTSASDFLTTEYKIIIHLSVKYITKNEKQWLKNENYLFSEFLQRVRAIESQLQKEYNEYRSDLHSE